MICVGLAAIAGWLVHGTWQNAAQVGAYFVGGLLVSLSLLYGVAALLLKVLQTARCARVDARDDAARAYPICTGRGANREPC